MALVGVNNLNSENKLGGLRNDTTSFTASNINSASLNTTSTQNMTGTNSLSVNASTESFDVFSSTTGNGNLQNTSNSAATTTTSGDLNMNHTLGNNQTQSTPNSQELYSEAPSTSTNNSTTQQPSGVSATSNTNSTTASNNYSQSNQGSNLTSSTNNMTGGTGTNSQGSIGGNVVNTGSTGSFQATSSMVSGTQATMNTGSGLSYANNTQAYNTGATSVTSASTSLTTSGNVSVSTEEYELMIEDFRKQLRNIGIKDYDIDRVINGELTLEELWNEIYNETSNDPKSTTKRDILEATTIHALNESLPEIDLNYNSIAEMNQEIDRLTREIEAARKEEMYQEISEADATRRLIEYMSSMGEDLEESLDNCTIAYKCRNENGDIVYFYGELGRIGTDLEVLEEISYRDMYGNSESCKKMYELVPKRTETYKDGFLGLWGDEKTREVQNLTWTQEQEDFYYKLGEQVMSEGYHDYFTDSEEVQKLLEERETLEYLRDYIDTELDYYLENIDPYINASDFEEKNEFDSKYEKIVSGINQGGYSVDYPKYIDDKEEMIAILSCLFNGSENIYGDVIYTYDSEGKISGAFSYTSGDDIFNHFKDNWGEILTDEEKEIFNYIVNTKGAEAAYEYLETIAPTLDQRWLETERLKDKEWAEKHPVLASIGSILITPFEGLSAACYSLNSLITGADLWRTDVYSRGDQWRSSVSAAIATDHPVWAFAYDTFMSMADTGALIALTTLTGGTATPLLSAVTMGSRAYVSSLNDALDRGVENNTAIAYAFGSATIETLCESYSVGHLMNLEEKVGTNTISFIKKLVPEDSIRAKALYIAAGAVTQGLAEGEEELCTEVLNFFWDQTLCKEKSTFNLTVQSYIASGMSEEEAILNAYKDEAKTCALSFAGGFFSGICFGGFQAGKITRQASLNHMNVFELDTEIRQMDEIRKLLEQTKAPTALAALSNVKTSINNGTLLQDAKTYITTKFNSVQNLETQTQINSETLNNTELERAKAELQSQLQALIDKRGLTFDEYVKQMGQIEGVDPKYKEQIEAKAKEVHQRAVEVEKAVSEMMKSLEVDGAHLEGFSHRYKSEDSIARKIMTRATELGISEATIEEVGNTGIKDSLRYTLILDQSNYSQGVYQSLMKLLDNGYQIVKANNSWGDAIYQGLNIGVLDPSGLNIELQFHTEGSFNTKEKLNHAYYEIGRSMYATEEEIKLANEIMQINQQQNVETINSMVGLDLAGILNNVELERAKTQLDSTANLGGLFNRVSKVQEQRNIASENYLQSVSYLNYPLLELNGYNQKSIEIANYRAQQGLRSVIVVNSTTDLDTYITRNLIRPELVSIKIPGALYKGKYSKQKYQSRMTYNAYEAQQIMERLTYILNTVDRSKSQVEQAYQVYSELGKYIRICREYEKIATQLQSDPASLQSFWDSVQGLRALIPNRFTGDATAICAGYSAVYYEIMKHLGIRCDYIRGTVTSDWSNGRPGGHAWNVIIAEDQLIPVDVTWFTSGGGNWFGGSTDFNISRVADQDETYKNFSTPYRPKYVAPQVQRQENIRQTENYGARVYKRNDGSYFTLSMLGHRTVNNTTLYKYAYSEWGPNGWNNARIIYTEIDVDKLPQQAQSGFINSLLLDSRVNQKVASNNGYIGYVDFNGKKYINESIIRFFAGYTKNYVDSNGLAVTVRKDLGPNVYQYYKFINDNGRTILNSIIVSSN